jgi:2-methylcitrate dehydratase PrpD
MHRLTGAPFEPGESPQVSAQFSVRYSVASALLRGRFETADIDPAAVLNAEVLSLASRVVVHVDEAAGRFGPACVSVRTVSGAEHALRLDSPPGTPAAPLSAADLLTKAKAGFVGAVLPMSAARADALIDALNAFESCTDATALFPRQAHEPDPPLLSPHLEVYPS